MSLKCAVYARKSTEQKGVAEEEKSVARQVELAQAFIARQGWGLAEGHTYVDDGISGAETTKLEARKKMLAAAESARRPFDVIVIMSLERLSRDDEELPTVVFALRDAGSPTTPSAAGCWP